MLSRFLRLPIRIVPRFKAPLLPVSRFAQPVSSLTHTPRASHSRLFSNFPARLNSSSPNSSSPNHSPSNENASLSQRLKHLIKSYGWYALGVYLIFGAFDMGLAFAAINIIGAEQVSRIAVSVKEMVANAIHSKPPEPGAQEVESMAASNEGFYAMIILAYSIHKTLFLPLRVGLTAAFTPRLVNWLRSRGWAGSAGTRRAAEEVRERFRRNK